MDNVAWLQFACNSDVKESVNTARRIVQEHVAGRAAENTEDGILQGPAFPTGPLAANPQDVLDGCAQGLRRSVRRAAHRKAAPRED